MIISFVSLVLASEQAHLCGECGSSELTAREEKSIIFSSRAVQLIQVSLLAGQSSSQCISSSLSKAVEPR